MVDDVVESVTLVFCFASLLLAALTAFGSDLPVVRSMTERSPTFFAHNITFALVIVLPAILWWAVN